MAEETTPNRTGEAAPSPAEEQAPVGSPTAEGGERPARKPKPSKAAEGGEGAEAGKPAAKAAKKEKAPAVEDKPFADFIQQDFLPALKEELAKQGIEAVELSFEKQKIAVTGFANEPDCWQVVGRWSSGRNQPRQFNLYFLKEDIQGPKVFSYSESGGKASTLEPFLGDERKITLSLLVFGVVQRLIAQKWLVRN
ncbi:DUF2996 domain-containing protein [Leptothermofonsia sp. ETS-13]|uniref:DUF2996 domain-containing protein n=1 Tax=Leptothermofonsia sp. ETS-13 TaxID=3035696 RepID=UPI003B9E7BCD